MNKLINYVNGLEKAYALIDSDSDFIIEFTPDWLRENFCDHENVQWVFSQPNQGSLGGMCHVHKKSYPKYITYIGAVRM